MRLGNESREQLKASCQSTHSPDSVSFKLSSVKWKYDHPAPIKLVKPWRFPGWVGQVILPNSEIIHAGFPTVLSFTCGCSYFLSAQLCLGISQKNNLSGKR